MFSKYRLFLLAALCSVFAGANLQAGRIIQDGMFEQSSASGELCSQGSCKHDYSCQCYCSVKCGPREQLPDDSPVFIGDRCWCKKWDQKNYKANCLQQKKQGRRSSRKQSRQQ